VPLAEFHTGTFNPVKLLLMIALSVTLWLMLALTALLLFSTR
jgi:hypothetical protein